MHQERRGKTLYHFYDLNHAPPTFNFILQLVSAEFARIETTDCDYIHTVFIPGKNDGFNPINAYGVDVKQHRLLSILLPALSLYKSNTSYSLLQTREEAQQLIEAAGPYKFPIGYELDPSSDCLQFNTSILNACLGYKPKSISAPDRAVALVKQLISRVCPDQKFITITARGSTHLAQRNSSPATLTKIAKYMQQHGYFVFFLPDYDVAFQVSDNCIPGAYIAREVALNLPFRSALYELASLNIGDGGPASLFYFNTRCNYIYTNQNWPDDKRDMQKVLRQEGLVNGKGVNYYNTFARWIWKFDDAEETINTCAEFIEYSQGRGVDNVKKHIATLDEVLDSLSESLGVDAVNIINSKYSNRQNGPLFINREFTWDEKQKRNMKYVIKSAQQTNNDFNFM